VVRSLEQPVVDPTYLEFFGLTKPPFARLADPSQLFPSEQYSLLTEHLANATTNPDSLVVICGADGSGKSTLLNRFISSIGDRISCVVIDETCHGEEQFYSAFLTQIGFAEITGTVKELKNITKEFLVCRGIAGDHVLVMIDNAHLADPMILEQLLWLCEIKIKNRRVLSVVLTGNANIVRVVDAPAMRQTKFRSHVVFSIRNYSEEETTNYVWHRLRLAGGIDGVKLANEANLLIHRYSGGIPHLINRLCNDMLAEAYGLESRVITEKIVRSVADKQQLLPHVIPLHGKGRRTSDPDFNRVQVTPEAAGVDPENLLQQIAQLSEQLDDLRADKTKALQDIDARNNDIVVLRDELDSQTTEVEKLTRSLANNAEEITQNNLALSNSTTALQDSENRSKKLAADLEKEIHAREAAQNELAEAAVNVEELSQQKTELQATFDNVHSDVKTRLKAADERAAEIDALETNSSDLKGEIEGKTAELDSLRDELNSRIEALADLETRLEESQAECESAHLHIAALKNPEELEEIKKASDKRAADLRKESRARKAAQKELAKSTATVEELSQQKTELNVTIRDLNADLRLAGERAVDVYVLERNVTDLKDEVEKSTRELDSRNEVVVDLENQLDTSERECELLRRRGTASNIDEDIVSEEAVTASDRGAGVYSSLVVQKFAESMRNVRAYQTLQEYDPAFYVSLITTYKKLVAQDLTDNQINDALRAEQAKLMERLLPRASDDAIITYARLIVDQLDELQHDGIEPCLTLLIPESDPDIDTLLIYSESTKERELDTLDITLRSYDADRQPSAEGDVWPDLGPIFDELFEAFGADNVAALENSYDPSIDRDLVCNVSRALYSGILKLPKRNAANALRWLFST
jgi:general secretion pathway protein A